MHQENVISQLLAWIEQSLDQPLTLDSIAAKSGYSKWHLQRMFKQHTGEVLGTYARRRRLTAAARELRLTSATVACIADKYQFDSQQTFTRGFKKQFGLPPAAYRRSLDWPSYGLQPPLNMANEPMPEAEIIVLPSMKLVGHTHQGSCTLGQLGPSKKLLRQHAWRHLLHPEHGLPAVAYGLMSLKADTRQRDRQQMVYTAALPEEEAAGETVTIEPGEYARFAYQGQVAGLQNFIARLYDTAIPQMNAVRRPGQDIERFSPALGVCYGDDQAAISCEYLIPIRRGEEGSGLR
ncbi:helix-turn-helix domain-containing protein [Serratia sp. 3ACOL1]|uniref:helix-turn-helix domain-containing protein n=1 Tax=Serratia sp. 3ACOL1 TaxID=2448483 RepID=UPI000EF520E5|nr:helix-turn-helix domain-containing protein [Serratia sp. 3ACOL1]AYM93351.1 helix-turn-helix domain-containing protein [Serratia sp. 3ACOL1]